MKDVTTNIIGFYLAFIIMLIIVSPIFSSIGKAIENLDPFDYDLSSNDLWNNLSEFEHSKGLYDYLSTRGLIHYNVTFKDFDYILVMVDQICTMYPNVKPSLVMALIARESNFNQFDVCDGARGLTQLMVSHKIRLEQFVESDHIVTADDFFDIRLNLATGIDYLSELILNTDGDEVYALMCYNQGPTSARKTYIDCGIVSDYASFIKTLSREIEPYFTTQEVNNV